MTAIKCTDRMGFIEITRFIEFTRFVSPDPVYIHLAR